MKLIFENWRRYLEEEEQLDEKLALEKRQDGLVEILRTRCSSI